MDKEGRQMRWRSWKTWLVSGAALVVIAVVVFVLIPGKESLRGKIVKLEGNTVTVQEQGGQTKMVKLSSAEGLTTGTEVEIENYRADTMTGDKAHLVPQ